MDASRIADLCRALGWPKPVVSAGAAVITIPLAEPKPPAPPGKRGPRLSGMTTEEFAAHCDGMTDVEVAARLSAATGRKYAHTDVNTLRHGRRGRKPSRVIAGAIEGGALKKIELERK